MADQQQATVPSPQPSGHGRAAFIFIFVTVLLDMLALGVVVPVLPKLVVQFEHGDIAVAAKQVGIFAFIFAAMQFLFSPMIGVLSDRFGRRPVVLLSNFGLGFDYLLMGWAPTLNWLFLGRVISGITSDSFPTGVAYIADVTPEDQRAAQFGMLGAAFGLGFIIGPAVGGFLGTFGLRYPFWVAGALSLLNAAYGYFILPESLPPERRARSFSLRKANPVGSLILLRSHPELAGLACALFLYYLAHESLPSMWVIYTDYRYHWGPGITGGVLAAVGVGSTLVSAVLISFAIKRLGELRTLFTGLFFGIVGFAVYAWAPSTVIFLIGCPLVSLWGLAGPAIQSLMSRRVGSSEQGQLQGANTSMLGVAGMIAPLMFTYLFAASIPRFPGTPYWLASLLLVGSFLIVWLVFRPAVARAPITESSD